MPNPVRLILYSADALSLGGAGKPVPRSSSIIQDCLHVTIVRSLCQRQAQFVRGLKILDLLSQGHVGSGLEI